MLKTAFLLGCLLSVGVLFAQVADHSEIETEPLVLGQKIRVSSQHLNQKRELNIFLPTTYTDSVSKRYPVIYVLDGGMQEDFLHITGLVHFATFPWAPLIKESIVVGISNIDRKHDFTYPTKNAQDKIDFPTTGGSAAFIKFMKEEVQPLIANRYRVTQKKTLIGQSLGGLLATEILWKYPETFTTYIIVSPSLWWDDNSLLSLQRANIDTTKEVFIGVGKEGPIMESAAFALTSILQQDQHIKTHFKYLEELDHSNILHQAVYEAFKAFSHKDKTRTHD